MQAVIRKYSGRNAANLFDLLEQRVAEVQSTIGAVNGLVSYTLVRSGDGGFSLTLCQDKAGIDESVRKAKDWIAKNAGNSAPAPEVTDGKVIVNLTSLEQNKAKVRRVNEEISNKGNLDLISELFDANYVRRDPFFGETRGQDGLRQLIAKVRAAYPDVKFTIEDQIGEGEKVVHRWSCVGTNRGEFMGMPATGKRVKFTGVTISRFSRGKIVEQWVVSDALGVLQQTGLVPAIANLKSKI